MLNKLRNIVETNAAMPIRGPEYMYVLSPAAHIGLDSLFTNQQRFLGRVGIAGGLIVNSYAGHPAREVLDGRAWHAPGRHADDRDLAVGVKPDRLARRWRALLQAHRGHAAVW